VKRFPLMPPGMLLAVAALCQAQTAPVSFTISTVAGNNTADYSGDGSSAVNAELNLPTQVWLQGSSLYIADQANHTIRKVSGGTISTVAGDNTAGSNGDGAAATSAELSSPSGVAVDSKGNIFISDTGNNSIREVSGSIINTIASDYLLTTPGALAMDSAGNLYVADTGASQIKRYTSSSGTFTVTAIAGNGTKGQSGIGGTANRAQLNTPAAITISPSGDLYITDTGNGLVLMVPGASPTAKLTLVAGGGTLTDDGKLATLTKLNYPKGVAVDACGDVFISDTFNQRIRMVTPNGLIYTVAGMTNSYGFTGDGGPALSAQLNYPTGLLLDSSGNLYVADTANSVIRLLTVSGAVPCAQPSIGGIITAGNFGAFNSAAPGSWIEIYGSNLAADTRQWASSDFVVGPSGTTAPTQIDRTSVQISNASAFVDYVSPGQVNAQVPSNVPTGSQRITVTTAAGVSNTFNLQINAVQPGLFAPPQLSIGGTQYAGAVLQDGSWALPAGAVAGINSRPAKAGDIITLYGVGFGGVNTGVSAGQVVQDQNSLSATTFQMTIGQTPAYLQYWGLEPGAVGLYQFNVEVPAGAGTGAVPLTFSMTVNGQTFTGAQTLYVALQ
jgi:uncharacterized protein (TIGR03437 family)